MLLTYTLRESPIFGVRIISNKDLFLLAAYVTSKTAVFGNGLFQPSMDQIEFVELRPSVKKIVVNIGAKMA